MLAVSWIVNAMTCDSNSVVDTWFQRGQSMSEYSRIEIM